MMKGLLPDSAIVGTVGHAKHYAHKANHGRGRKSMTVFGAFAVAASAYSAPRRLLKTHLLSIK